MVKGSIANNVLSSAEGPTGESDTAGGGIRDSHPSYYTHTLGRPTPPSLSTFHLLAALLFLLATATGVSAQHDGDTLSDLARRASVTASAAAASLTCACPESSADVKKSVLFAVEATMIPVLVILSGITAGLTLGYMSLDSTQLNVLAKTGTPKQQYYAKRVIPIRKDGHLLLITLLIANMIVNETLPVIADGVLGGGVQAVVISTVLVIIFSEIIPQSVCSRFGLAIGSAMVWPVQILIWAFFFISWPVARLLNYVLGPHHGIVYRRAELRELISMHSMAGEHGGDLDQDTITIVGATLDLQTKVVSDAMTPISKVFSLPITSKLDYETLGRVLKAGHSRIPVYEEVGLGDKKRNKVVGVLLTKQLILLDPEDAVPLREIPMNALPTVPSDLPLLQILNTFQEGRSHMAIVCRRKTTFNPLSATNSTSSLRNTTGLSQNDRDQMNAADSDMEKGAATGEQSLLRNLFHAMKRDRSGSGGSGDGEEGEKAKDAMGQLARTTGSRSSLNFQLDEDKPLGVITLEDVLEELIGEEIYDETDQIGLQKPALEAYIPPEAVGILAAVGRIGIGMGRSRSAPGKARQSATPPDASAFVGELEKEASTADDEKTADDKEAAGAPAGLEGLSLITELSSSDEDDERKTVSPADARSPPPANLAFVPRRPTDGPVVPPSPLVPVHPRPAPPLLSDAVLLERGRRMLVAQGADPSALPVLRLAAPRSGTPTPAPSSAGTAAGRLVVPPPAVGVAVKKGLFKSPALPVAVSGRSTPKMVEAKKEDAEEEDEEKEDKKKDKKD